MVIDDEPDGVAVVEPENAPADAQTDPVVNDHAPDPVDTLASEMGWAPKDQFKGNPEDWKPAADFIKAGRDIQKTLSRELKDVRSTVETMSRTQGALLQQQIEERDAYWLGKRREAIQEGDEAAVEHADRQREHLARQVPSPHTEDPAGRTFVERHSAWWGKDTEATRYAVGRADYYAQQGVSGDRQIRAVEQDMKGIFPDLFPAAAKPPPAVSAPASRSATPANRAKSFHDLTPAEQRVARDMADRGVIQNVDAYVKARFQQEKVG